MSDSHVISLHKPVADDPLQTILREGARQLLANAISSFQLETNKTIKINMIRIFDLFLQSHKLLILRMKYF